MAVRSAIGDLQRARVAVGVRLQTLLMRADRQIMTLIDVERPARRRARELVRDGFATAMRYPIHGLVYTVATWASAGLVDPDRAAAALPGSADRGRASSILVAALIGGSLATLFTFFADKRMAAPLRDRWAGADPRPAGAPRADPPLPLAAKLRAGVTAIVRGRGGRRRAALATCSSQRPIESYATRIQSGSLLRMAGARRRPRRPRADSSRAPISRSSGSARTS